MPPDRATFAVGQRFDLRVEATADGGPAAAPPSGLIVTINGEDITARNILDAGASGGERGSGGVGATAASLAATWKATAAPAFTTNFLLRDYAFEKPGSYVIAAKTADGATAQVTVTAGVWIRSARDAAAHAAKARAQRATSRQARQRGNNAGPRAKNIILLLGDGMGIGASHGRARRLARRRDGKANAPLAMDTLEVTGQVMTLVAQRRHHRLGAGHVVLLDRPEGQQQPGRRLSRTTPPDPFDNPRVEYIGELLRRTRGARLQRRHRHHRRRHRCDARRQRRAHRRSQRRAAASPTRFFDERATNGVTVLLGGGAPPLPAEGGRRRARGRPRRSADEFIGGRLSPRAAPAADVAGAARRRPRRPRSCSACSTRRTCRWPSTRSAPARTATSWRSTKNAALRDQPMLDDMTRSRCAVCAANSPAGFYLMVEGASIDKQAHASDAERMIWDTIEFDNAVQRRARLRRRDQHATPIRPTTRWSSSPPITRPAASASSASATSATRRRRSARRCATTPRCSASQPTQMLNFVPNYESTRRASRSIRIRRASCCSAGRRGPDRYENWLSNRLCAGCARCASVAENARGPAGTVDETRVSIANTPPRRHAPDSDNKIRRRRRVPRLPRARRDRKRRARLSRARPSVPADTSSDGHTSSAATPAATCRSRRAAPARSSSPAPTTTPTCS